MKNYLNVLRNNYVNFSGRARRHEYWMFAVIHGVIVLLLQLPYIVTGPAQLAAGEPLTGLALISLILASIYSLATFLPALAVAVRRLHDTGRTGWWYLIAFVPLVGSIVFLIFLVLDSQPGANKWGPNPKGLENAAGSAAW